MLATGSVCRDPRELSEREHDGTILRLPTGIWRIIGAPVVVAFPGIGVILSRDLNRLISRTKGKESGPFRQIMQLAARVRPRPYDAQTTERSHPSVGSQRV
jgi:hypothetical protein